MISFEKTVHFGRGSRTERQLREGLEPPPGRIPRISRLMALAIHYDELLRNGVVKSLTELAELGHVSKTRITHMFLRQVEGLTFDVMLEAKAKDLALLRLRRDLPRYAPDQASRFGIDQVATVPVEPEPSEKVIAD